MLAKPEPLKRTRARNKRQHAQARLDCVNAVWKRAQSCCEICGKFLKRPRETDSIMDVGHVHEIAYRSRGGSDTDPLNCQLLCAVCHEKVHAHRFTD